VSIGKRIDPETLAQIKIGESTRADVEKLIGSPQIVSERPDGGTTLTYWHGKGWMIPPGYLLSAGLHHAKVPFAGSVIQKLWTGGSSKTECVAITFDRNGMVSDVTAGVLKLEGGPGLLDRNRQSLSYTSRNEPDSSDTEAGRSSPSDRYPGSAESASKPREPPEPR
jgi:hypothetical protein